MYHSPLNHLTSAQNQTMLSGHKHSKSIYKYNGGIIRHKKLTPQHPGHVVTRQETFIYVYTVNAFSNKENITVTITTYSSTVNKEQRTG